jgi:uncharacterized protein YjbI with pentapeptide repeats
MRGADLTRCNLTGASLVGADLTGANLSYSDFRDANLDYATLAGAIVNESDFRGAGLRHAELATASMGGVMLAHAVLSQAHLSRTVFARCLDLSQAVGLDALRYSSPSSIDLESLRGRLADLPEDFLEGVGLEPREIAALRAVAAT